MRGVRLGGDSEVLASLNDTYDVKPSASPMFNRPERRSVRIRRASYGAEARSLTRNRNSIVAKTEVGSPVMKKPYEPMYVREPNNTSVERLLEENRELQRKTFR